MSDERQARDTQRQAPMTRPMDSITVIVGSAVTGVLSKKVIALDKWTVAMDRALRNTQLSSDDFFRLQKNAMDLTKAFDAVIQEMKRHPSITNEHNRLSRIARHPDRRPNGHAQGKAINQTARPAQPSLQLKAAPKTPVPTGKSEKKSNGARAPETIAVPANREPDSTGLA